MSEKAAENKMGVMPINKLILSMSLPMVVANLVQALYNIVDSIFVSRIDEKALTAVSMAFPIQMLTIAISVGTGVGINALLSRFLGEKDRKAASNVAVNGVYLVGVSYFIFLIIGLFLVDPFYRSQTTDPMILFYGHQYLTYVCCLSIGIFLQITFERLLQSTGLTFYAMITQGTGAVINMILDPILIFGLLGMPKLGVAGAAIATVFGQITASILAVIINVKKNKEIELNFSKYKPDFAVIRNIYKIGVPSIIMQAIGSVMNYCMNKILIGFTSTAVAVFGVYFKLQSFIFMPVFGLNNGMIPIIAYNYGAQNRKRLEKTIKTSLIAAIIIMSIGTILFETIPDTLLSIFDASDNMKQLGATALRIIGIHFPVAAMCIIFGAVFQALGNAVYSMITSIMRQIVVLIPAAFLLSMLGNVNYVWWAFPIAEVMSFIVNVYFMIRITNRIISKLPDGAPA